MAQFEPFVSIKEVSRDEPLRVSLINYHNYQVNEAISGTFLEFCRSKQIAIQKANYSPELIIFRLSNITQDSFEEIKDFEALETITQMPKYSMSLDELTPIKDEPQIKIKEPQKIEPTRLLGYSIRE
ncbi:hypothetical protein SNE26_23010 [Mucilaginibacter sp. cycad4]|uniref:hypothetical protein n=1 Tax=Mucilaginibacter sp. cycad4 TaxID=3342096 RepID=UPI002AAB28FC|nr:hypothetical protein [Mucilaginibacter gossypii]WPU98887.1 hypothetical protein SNE26_23010 [Mucilaginibacter gossypii]